MKNIEILAEEIKKELSKIADNEDKIDAINYLRKKIHEESPLKHHPADCVVWEKSERVEGNDYNPNNVAPPEMKLLIKSIKEDGYTMPIVTFLDKGGVKIVDGFHRRKAERSCKDISESTLGRLPVTYIRESQKGTSDRMASTIRHNRARGTHDIKLMSNIVGELVDVGMSDMWILKNIGMDTDELLRLKQVTGLASLFKNGEFSKAWK